MAEKIDDRWEILVDDQADLQVRKDITAILNQANEQFGHKWASQPLQLYVQDKSGRTVAGLSGSTNWGWLHVELLAVERTLRRSGLGSRLLLRAEEIARSRGCSNSFLDTFSFQARHFYEKHGYTVYGELENFPTGASRYFLKKSLQVSAQISSKDNQ